MTLKEVVYVEINDSKRSNLVRTIKSIFLNYSKSVVFFYRISYILHKKGYKILPFIINRAIFKRFGVDINLSAQIDLGLVLPHPNGIIIGKGSKIGRNCKIFHQTTIGVKKKGDEIDLKYPVIGDNVTIFAGAKVLGEILVGNNSIIGANSVVTKNIETNSIYVGIPAKKIGSSV